MSARDNPPVAEGESPFIPLTVLVGATLVVFALNLLILGYAVWTTESARHEAPAGAVLPEGTGAADERRPVVRNPIQWPEESRVRTMFVRHCAGCHGPEGQGDGPGAALLLPRPRNFVESPFHFVPAGGTSSEVIGALRRTIERGVPQSAMLGWRGVLSEDEIAGLARYVFDVRAKSGETWPVLSVDVGERPPFTPALVARGNALFVSLACNSCHGDTGHGDGPSAWEQVDFLGNPARPADLGSGVFKSGPAPEDLCRTILTGIPGTPMASFAAIVSGKNEDGTQNVLDAWALVAYVMSLLSQPPSRGMTSGAEISVVRVQDEAMLSDAGDRAWLGIAPTVLALKPLRQGLEQVTRLSVRAVRGTTRLALCLEWREETMNLRGDGDSAADAAAVLFAVGKEVPALPMGGRVEGHTPPAPVNVWHWSADRQAKTAGSAQPPDGVRASDGGGPSYSFGPGSASAVREAGAEGFGPLTIQASEHQDVTATASWTNGLWRVVLVRDLAADEPGDVDLSAAGRVPVSFAVWDGAKGHRGAVKLITAWHWLNARPSP